jgi:hypothetical protein
MKELFQTPGFYNAVAAGTAALLGIAFLLFAKPKKVKYRLVVDPKEDVNLLTARDCYTFIKTVIKGSRNLAELNKTMPLIEGYRTKKFRLRVSNSVRMNYYEDLLIEYCDKEQELENIPVVVSKN